eukprot:Skav215865  [mRNA]  locus=scaffold1079:108537:114550:+ [translate_table: standard]
MIHNVGKLVESHELLKLLLDLEALVMIANKHKEQLEQKHVFAQKEMEGAEKELAEWEAKLKNATSAADEAQARASKARWRGALAGP